MLLESGVVIYQGIRLGTALIAAANRALGAETEAYSDPDGAVAKFRSFLGKPSGPDLLQAKAYEPLAPWLERRLHDGKVTAGDIEAAEYAVVLTLKTLDGAQLALLSLADQGALKRKLASKGAPHRRSLASPQAEVIYDKLLDSSVQMVRTLTPGPTNTLAQALRILHEWIDDLGFAHRFDSVDTQLGAIADKTDGIARGQGEIASQLAEIAAAIKTEASDRYRLANAPLHHVDLIAALSPMRMSRFLQLSEGDEREAMRLYHWNQSVSAQVYLAVHILEVVLRNAIDAQLRIFNPLQEGNHSPDWTLDPCSLITAITVTSDRDRTPVDHLHEAVAGARKTHLRSRQNRQVTHNDVIAHTGLRIWRNFIPTTPGRAGRFRNALWRESVHRAFPHLAASEYVLGATVERILLARNRAAHLEPFLSARRLDETYADITFVLRAVSGPVDQWFQSRQELTPLLEHPLAARTALDPPEPPA